MTKQELDVIEAGLDAAEKIIAQAEDVGDAWLIFRKQDKPKLILCVGLMASGVALAAGTTGWLLAEKRLKTKYEQISADEIAEAKVFYSRLRKPATVQEAAEARLPSLEEATSALLAYQGTPEEVVEEPEEIVKVVNVFEAAAEGTRNLTDEDIESRDAGKGYVIDHDDFMQNDDDHNQVTLTYYEGDNTLADENEEAIPIPENIVGDALQKFGVGSRDARTVYVRNDRLNLDFEVVKSDGKFSREVLGFHHSNEHGSRQRDRHERRNQNRRFRDSDE